jgi:hypothetical protein
VSEFTEFCQSLKKAVSGKEEEEEEEKREDPRLNMLSDGPAGTYRNSHNSRLHNSK